MGKFTLIIAGFYLCYYAGNIAYDLLLKKYSIKQDDETEELFLEEFAEQVHTEAQKVTIEDVENLNLPASFNKSELFINDEPLNERGDINVWREKFESEQDIDAFQSERFNTNKVTAESEILPLVNENIKVEKMEKDNSSLLDLNRERFRNLLNLAETSVQLIAHPDGYKIYHSIM